MSISTQGGDQSRPSVVSTGKQAPGATAGAGKAGGTAKGGRPGARPAGGGGGGGKGPRKPVKPVKVSTGRSWGPIALFAAVGLLAVGIIGYGGWAVYQGARSWQDRAADIDGVVNYRETKPDLMAAGKHQAGKVQYTVSPPVAGPHNNKWQNCTGNVYTEPIASEHAVHSLEHGAVWVTYKPDLPKDQVAALAKRVEGEEKTFMSPYEGLDQPISLQAWGYQLKVQDAGDERIDQFIKALRVNASVEGPTALCSEGITATGTTPREIPTQQ
ncbi:MAG TPA: DUF3105 domain-containing protein [Pilimelia sp.]|nr:DUF3105 domain-containing protein [Pilimelia sp.]